MLTECGNCSIMKKRRYMNEHLKTCLAPRGSHHYENSRPDSAEESVYVSSESESIDSDEYYGDDDGDDLLANDNLRKRKRALEAASISKAKAADKRVRREERHVVNKLKCQTLEAEVAALEKA